MSSKFPTGVGIKYNFPMIENIVYKDMLHEVLNEVDKEQVYKDVLDFIEK